MRYRRRVSVKGYVEDGRDGNIELIGRRTTRYAMPTVNQLEFSPYLLF
jgi:hypothetical protein